MEKRQKQHINFVFVGHSQSGKSTTAGHLCYKCGVVDDDTMNKFASCLSANFYSPASKYAWVLDKLSHERELRHSMNVNAKHFETEKSAITVYDAPGKSNFCMNMMSGVS